jgi:hypothetical protein
MGFLDFMADRPTLVDRQRERYAKAKGADKSRREVNADKAKDEAKDEARWKKQLRKRDGDECRWCHRKLVDCLDRLPERRECHHVSGKVVRAIRWDRRNGLTLCGSCHDRVTGKVAEKFLIHSRHTFTVDGIQYINADKPVRFKRVA